MFETDFLHASAASQAAHHDALLQALALLQKSWPDTPYTGKSPSQLADLLKCQPLPEVGVPTHNVLGWAAKIVSNSIVPSHPRVMAHLHCPPLISALAAEVVLSALNQSMDSFDQAPAATIVEQMLTRWLCDEAGLPGGSDGTFTAGGSQSNYMGLLLARDASLESRFNWKARERGLPAEANRLRILCSEVAHFTVEKSAAQLGLGTGAVIKVAVDDNFRMRPEHLRNRLAEVQQQNLIPMVVVATAGTTDFGSIDPLPEIAELAHAQGAWLYVDAAYGGALLFSKRHRELLKGIELADSVGVDFHKLFWQPISCAAFLLRDSRHFRFIEMHSDYLNPESHENDGIPDLVTRSLLTTRRFDALKLCISLQTMGREKLASMIDRTLDLAQHAAQCIRAAENLELLHDPILGCVVFRYLPRGSALTADALNAEIRQRLFDQGRAVIGHTRVRGRQCLKLTILNPMVDEHQITKLLEEVQTVGIEAESNRKQTAQT